MNTKITALAGAAALALTGILGTTAAAASPAASHSLPKVQTAGMTAGWHPTNPGWRIRPGIIYFGAMYEIKKISWSTWTSTGAYGRGRLVACAGAAGPCERATVNIHLWNVHSHSGPGRYFKDLKYTGRYKQFMHISDGVWVWTSNASLMSLHLPVVYQAGGSPAVRPATFAISRSPAGGSGFFMTDLRWSRWNRTSAAGRGREYSSR
jgi:hypothetical protein